MMEGENFVSLKGWIQQSNLKTVGDQNSMLFKGKFLLLGIYCLPILNYWFLV